MHHQRQDVFEDNDETERLAREENDVEDEDDLDVNSQIQSEYKENPIAVYAATHHMLNKQF